MGGNVSSLRSSCDKAVQLHFFYRNVLNGLQKRHQSRIIQPIWDMRGVMFEYRSGRVCAQRGPQETIDIDGWNGARGGRVAPETWMGLSRAYLKSSTKVFVPTVDAGFIRWTVVPN